MVILSVGYLVTVSLGCFLELFILNRFLGYELKIKKIPLAIAAVGLVSLLLALIWKNAIDYADMAMSLFYMIIPYFVLKSSKKLLFLIFGFSIDCIFNVLTQLTFLLFLGDLTDNLFNAITCTWFIACIVVSTFLHYKMHFIIPKFFLEKIPTLFYILFFLVLFVAALMLDENRELLGPVGMYVSGVFTILAFIGISYIVVKYITVSAKQKESLIQLDMQAKHYEELAKKNRDIRRFRHDIKNNLLALNILLSDNEFDEAKKYINNMSESIKETESRFSTGSYFADAILSQKSDEISKKNISIVFEGSLPSDKIQNNDLCTVLTNSIDNASRACAELAPCSITIKSDETKNGCTIVITNPVSKRVEIKNNEIKTTKGDSINHGFGIENIKRAAEKYKGFVRLDCSDTEFIIKIGLLY